MKKRILAFLLGCMLAFPMSAASAMAAEGETVSSIVPENEEITDENVMSAAGQEDEIFVSGEEEAYIEDSLLQDGEDLGTGEDEMLIEDESQKLADSQEETAAIGVSYAANMYKTGWQSAVEDGAISGASGKRLESFKISLTGAEEKDLALSYKAYVYTKGWQEPVSDGEIAGTVGQNLGLEAISISLTGADADSYDIYYRVSTKGFGWLDWAKNGAYAGSKDYVYRIEQMQIKIVEKDGEAPGETTCPYFEIPTWNTRTYQYSYGWNKWTTNSTASGHTGTNKRIEAMELKVSGAADLGISYQVYQQSGGWTTSVADGETAGIPDCASNKRISAIRISLTGEAADYFDVYYRVYLPGFGWLHWTSNGAFSGSTGLGYNIQGVQVRIRAIGKGAPGKTITTFFDGSSYSSVQKKAMAVLKSTGGTLKGAYNWGTGIKYYKNTPKPASGKDHLTYYANYAYTYKRGNCYGKAASFCMMARLLGYTCNFREGYVVSKTGGLAEHGWTEIYINGEKYVVDVSGKDWMIHYGDKGTWVYTDLNGKKIKN